LRQAPLAAPLGFAPSWSANLSPEGSHTRIASTHPLRGKWGGSQFLLGHKRTLDLLRGPSVPR